MIAVTLWLEIVLVSSVFAQFILPDGETCETFCKLNTSQIPSLESVRVSITFESENFDVRIF